MKKEEASKLCLDYLDIMQPILKHLIINVEKLKKRLIREDVKSIYIMDVYKILHEIIEDCIPADYEYAYNLIPEEMWKTYKLMGYKGLREQVILCDVIKRFRKSWDKMPIFRSVEHVKQNQKKSAKK